jgi:hypothetical protein
MKPSIVPKNEHPEERLKIQQNKLGCRRGVSRHRRRKSPEDRKNSMN